MIEDIKKMYDEGKIIPYVVIVEDYEAVIRFDIDKRLIPMQQHLVKIQEHMADKYPRKDYIIALYTDHVRII